MIGSLVLLAAAKNVCAQETGSAEIRVNVVTSNHEARHPVPMAVWLSPLPGTPVVPFEPHGQFTLLQKNRMFTPHLQVVPVGAVVQFPNEDPFFHNVFSLFDGKRFDLGLYEAGSTKAVRFPREGVSYIFCNIHPEMSAVILTLSTPFYATGKTGETLTIRDVPVGDYVVDVWVEGAQKEALEADQRRLHIGRGAVSQGQIVVDTSLTTGHKDKFGKDYPMDSKPTY